MYLPTRYKMLTRARFLDFSFILSANSNKTSNQICSADAQLSSAGPFIILTLDFVFSPLTYYRFFRQVLILLSPLAPCFSSFFDTVRLSLKQTRRVGQSRFAEFQRQPKGAPCIFNIGSEVRFSVEMPVHLPPHTFSNNTNYAKWHACPGVASFFSVFISLLGLLPEEGLFQHTKINSSTHLEEKRP